MIINVHTWHRRLLLKLTVRTTHPQSIGIFLIDRNKPKRFYYKAVSDLQDAGEHVIEIPMPQTPGILSVYLYDADTGREPDIQVKVTKHKLHTKEHLLSRAARRRLKFLMDFAADAKYIPANKVVTDFDRKIYYYDTITNPDGSKEITPARVDDQRGDIDVGKQKIEICSIYTLTFILTHEDAHSHENEEFYNEFEADKKGLITYLYSGHPSNQAMYSMTKIFNETELNMQRAAALEQYIAEFNETGEIR